jgi:translocation and assembly module TamA
MDCSAALRRLALLLLFLPALATADVVSIEVRAQEPLHSFVAKNLTLPTFSGDSDESERFATVRSLRQQAVDLLATEGYFEPQVNVVFEDRPTIAVIIEPGRRISVSAVELQFTGAIAEAGDAHQQRIEALRAGWSLPAGQPFRQVDWEHAKQSLMSLLLANDFAAASIAESAAEIDPATGTAALRVTYDSGPAFTMGALEIIGLERYERSLIERYNTIRPGDAYAQAALETLQRTLQNTPYFSSVVVDIYTDTTHATNAPLRVRVVEAKSRRLSFSAGYSSNDGPRGEVNFSNANILDRGWQLSTGLRVARTDQLAYADIHLPARVEDFRDSFGTLAERAENQGLDTHRVAFGVVRARIRGWLETRYSLNYQEEQRAVDAGQKTRQAALALNGSLTWRNVDNVLDPRSGQVINLQLGGGSRFLLSDQDFLRFILRGQQYWPIGERDVLTARIDAGWTAANTRQGIPEDFLFRAGGAQSVRGYSYQSIGVAEANAIVGGRYLVTTSVEGVHWFTREWGTAVFFDAGRATDQTADLFPLLRGYGLGARWRSPAGPLGLDLAYSQRDHKVRPSFAIAIAF